MTQDISPEAYQEYVTRNEILNRRWFPNEPLVMYTYEEWVDITLARDHPSYPEYIDARRDWKASTFHLRYGPFVGGERIVPKFSSFSEWLEQKHDDEYNPDEKETTA